MEYISAIALSIFEGVLNCICHLQNVRQLVYSGLNMLKIVPCNTPDLLLAYLWLFSKWLLQWSVAVWSGFLAFIGLRLSRSGKHRDPWYKQLVMLRYCIKHIKNSRKICIMFHLHKHLHFISIGGTPLLCILEKHHLNVSLHHDYRICTDGAYSTQYHF